MNRRNALRSMAGALVGLSAGFKLRLAQAQDYTDTLLVAIQADGGWDPTCFCDPKTNTPGEPDITHWSDNDVVQYAGNIPYAPFADNERFFRKYHNQMLVINGVDAQTNSHDVGIVHNWSGRNSEGFPTLTALMAEHKGNGLPAPYLSFGGFSFTADITRYTRLDSPDNLRKISSPYKTTDGRRLISVDDWDALLEYNGDTALRLGQRQGIMPAEQRLSSNYRNSITSDDLKRFASRIPPNHELEVNECSGMIPGSDSDGYCSDLRRQAQLAVHAFEAGVSVSADLRLGGFDTHNIHDPDFGWLIGRLTDGVDYLWEYAQAHGIDDRLVVLIGSDFARTNFYNATNGKDHWPVGSFIVMQKGQPWTNRSINGTDHLQFAQKIDPLTLETNEYEGSIIYPNHVHKALRKHLGMQESYGSLRHPFNNVDDFAFFDIPA